MPNKFSYAIRIVSAFMFGCWVIYCAYDYSQSDNNQIKWYRENITGISYRGIITQKYLDPDGRYQPVFILEDGEKYRFF
jgi:hypothetical protein